MTERTEGWANLHNAKKAHYFKEDCRSLCGRWLSWGPPNWETNQSLGDKPDLGTCAVCWKLAKEKESP